MALMHRVLKLLFPPGHAWTLMGELGDLVDALAESFSRLRTFFRGVLTESLPGTAVDTLQEWFEAIGLIYDETQPLADRQAAANAAYTSFGGQNLDYLNLQIQKEYPLIYLEEILGDAEKIYYYFVRGQIDDLADYNRIVDILVRIAPRHLVPVMIIEIADGADDWILVGDGTTPDAYCWATLGTDGLYDNLGLLLSGE